MPIELPRPKYISFDIIGTLIYFEMRKTVEPFVKDQFDPETLEAFFKDFSFIRYDEILEYRPYGEVLERSYQRICARYGIEATPEAIAAIQRDTLEWGAHSDVIEPLKKMAEHFPLVALSNADDKYLNAFIPRLEAPFHAVYTAEQAQAYKPRVQAFDYMLGQLDAKPEDFLHISSHQFYDHFPMYHLGFRNLAFLDRGYDLVHVPEYGSVRFTSLDDINTALGIN
ncbi:haloacid dehalogenase type II [Leucobacter rhizosphaerae]|uniref:Haloacid dehalogenase type II n=1 Tax=Leucobacter rhizosphaerae TaxID=2932245 RepID=A0ABY4FSS3_9MICO|nr:haloacid dehalogenase type II [Leucobacter rhizosphaerae]UOQ59310.1 haloacid dehalogenase type II [Leucobacter rhizosphaerae]